MKQIIAIRKDINMSEGKRVAQACHASLGAYNNSADSAKNLWEADGAKKIAVGIDGEKELKEKFKNAKIEDLPAYIVRDAGETELEEGTVTALGIGPAEDETVDRITEDLPLL
ncbi:MAG: peptidyl-tRNA hydrolase Pth2 [Candidatus Nanohaloarchaeota archaeon QJJ-7]|nr:peptidyl-tRNA hydrolase Pth2 [Candidatus Nanohaloarchaeota archaeon QJJ-7]